MGKLAFIYTAISRYTFGNNLEGNLAISIKILKHMYQGHLSGSVG